MFGPGIEPAPGAIEAIYAIGHAMLEQQRAHEAVKLFRVLLRLAPTDERGWLGLGACHEQMDEDSIAAELYGAGWTVAVPQSARCLAALSLITRRMGDHAAADEYLAESTALASETGLDLAMQGAA